MSRRGFELKKCERIDRISQLPDEIITHILSFLPLKDAVATGILSPRWLNLWKYIPNLIFINERFNEPMINIPPIAVPFEDPIDWVLVHSLKNAEWENSVLVHSLKNADWVNSVLNSYKALVVKQLTISFRMCQGAFHHVSKWLRFAFSRRVEYLKLDFQHTLCVLDTNTLSGIHISDYKFLREMTLAKLHVSGEAIEFLLRNCSLLEKLIMNGTLTSDLVIRGTLLKYLEIYPSDFSGKIIKVFTPNLTQLRCNYNYEKFFLEDVPNLVDASFILAAPQYTMHQFANEAAKLEILSITLVDPKELIVPQMPKLKKLVLDYSIVSLGYLLPVTCLLQASPYVEEFKFEISDYEMYFIAHMFTEAILEVPKHGNFRHNCLKVFEFAGFCDRARDHVELVTYIVNNCVALEEIIIIPICYAVACEFQQRTGISNRLLDEIGLVAEERHALAIKKSTEQLLLGKIPHHIKLIIKLAL